MTNWVEMGHTVGSLHHNTLKQKGKDVVHLVFEQHLERYEKAKREEKVKEKEVKK